jgi:hypothetical protein
MQKKLQIFIKNAELGNAKTRLAATIGKENALKVYHQLLDYTHNVSKACKAKKTVWYSKKVELEDRWEKDYFEKRVQVGNDLGERMDFAFHLSLPAEEESASILIGSDCAELTTQHLENAFEALKEVDVVLGPAEDGGYYLIGMTKPRPELFEGMKWSTSEVLKETLKRANASQLRVHLLETLRDVDTEEDWNQVKENLTQE